MYYKGQKMLISIYTNIFTEEQCKVKKKKCNFEIAPQKIKNYFLCNATEYITYAYMWINLEMKMKVLVAQLCLTLWDPMDLYSSPRSLVHRIL